jgi:hypothetical protein
MTRVLLEGFANTKTENLKRKGTRLLEINLYSH